MQPRRKPSVGDHNGRAVEAGLVFELAPKLEKAAIEERACKQAALHHPSDVQILDANPAIRFNDLCGGFVSSVFPDIGDARVQTSKAAPRL